MSSAEARSSTHQHTFLIRHRTALTWIPAAMFLWAVAVSPLSLGETKAHLAMEVAGYALIIAGALGRIWCGIYIAGRKNKELCQDGPYSLCRNPLYVFSFLGTVGVALATRVWWAAPIAAPLYWIYYYFVIRSEEVTLMQLFGADFDAYRAKVPMVWPALSNYSSRPEFTIAPRKLVQAMTDASWFLWAIVLLRLLDPIKAAHFHSHAVNLTLPF